MKRAYTKITDDVGLFDYEILAEGAKPCPFCGNPYIIVQTQEMFDRHDFRGISFECRKCHMEKWYFPPMDEHFNHPKVGYEKLYEELMKKWNARA